MTVDQRTEKCYSVCWLHIHTRTNVLLLYLRAGRNAAMTAQQQVIVWHLHGVPGVLVGVLLVDGPELLRAVSA